MDSYDFSEDRALLHAAVLYQRDLLLGMGVDPQLNEVDIAEMDTEMLSQVNEYLKKSIRKLTIGKDYL